MTQSTPPADEAAALASAVLEDIATGVCGSGGYDIYSRESGAGMHCTRFRRGHEGSFALIRHASTEAAELAFGGTPDPEEDTYSIGNGFMRELRWNPPCCFNGVSTR